MQDNGVLLFMKEWVSIIKGSYCAIRLSHTQNMAYKFLSVMLVSHARINWSHARKLQLFALSFSVLGNYSNAQWNCCFYKSTESLFHMSPVLTTKSILNCRHVVYAIAFG